VLRSFNKVKQNVVEWNNNSRAPYLGRSRVAPPPTTTIGASNKTSVQEKTRRQS